VGLTALRPTRHLQRTTHPEMLTPIRRHIFTQQDSGQTLAEYSLVVGLIAITVAAALPFVGTAVAQLYSQATAFFGG
jgi:Flp pilus assembly pilin Flp